MPKRTLALSLGNDKEFWTVIEDTGRDFSVMIGRGPESDLPLPALLSSVQRGTVSRKHVHIFRRDGRLWVEDLGSSNLTLLNGKVVFSPSELPIPSVLRLGQVTIHIDARSDGALPRHLVDDALKRFTPNETFALPAFDDVQLWQAVQRRVRWADALLSCANHMMRANRCEDVTRGLRESLEVLLRSEQVHASVEGGLDAVREIAEAAGVWEELSQRLPPNAEDSNENRFITFVAKDRATRVWCLSHGANPAASAMDQASIVTAKFDADGSALETEDANVIVEVLLRIGRPLVMALRELESYRARDTNVVSRQPSERMIEACREHHVWGESEGFRNCLFFAEQAALRYLNSDVFPGKLRAVFFLGESGTGKSALARLIHSISNHRKGPFEELNCAAIPDTLVESELFGYERGAHDKAFSAKAGFFERAKGGTLFLDEIGKTNPDFQSKLLKALDNGEFHRLGGAKAIKTNSYVIVAASENPQQLCDSGKLLQEFWYRTSAFTITIPPLRERQDDIAILAERRIETLNRATPDGEPKALSPEVVNLLKAYDWPGNIRELLQCIDVAYALSPLSEQVLTPDSLPRTFLDRIGLRARPAESTGFVMDTTKTLDDLTESVHREYLAAMVGQCEGNLSEVARRSGKAYQTIHTKLKNFRDWLRAAGNGNSAEIARLRELARGHWEIIERPDNS